MSLPKIPISVKNPDFFDYINRHHKRLKEEAWCIFRHEDKTHLHFVQYSITKTANINLAKIGYPQIVVFETFLDDKTKIIKIIFSNDQNINIKTKQLQEIAQNTINEVRAKL